ncbi:MAG TPA: FtsX-like permease family protein [Stellaceae bacterium]|nr:FtsX-like permease family protein [Stellaceae bacterium]
MLDRKLLRDLAQMKGQAITIALVVACGVAVFVAALSLYGSLRDAQGRYYAASHFADIFASLKRAPIALEPRLAELPGAAQLETRLVFDITIDLPAVSAPLSGRIIALPERGAPRLDRLYLRGGRMPEPDSPVEVLVSEGFAKANQLRPGSTLEAILNGKRQQLRIVGVALSPEYVYANPVGDPIPDDKRFGVFWISHKALAAAFDMDGAFNDVVLSLAPGASADAVMAALDRLLEPYGGLIAYGRYHQPSNRFVSDEIEQQRIMASTIPVVFLAVAAFLVNVVIGRVVQTQRAQIASLKALGYADGAIAVHYLKFVVIVVLGGAVLGFVLGVLTGQLTMASYTRFFRFPIFTLEIEPWVPVLAACVTLVAAMGGAIASLRSVVMLAPAEAMRPPAPPIFRRMRAKRHPPFHHLPARIVLILRDMTGRPLRTGLTTLGIALSVPIVVLSLFWKDALDYMIDVQFALAERGDAVVTFTQPVSSQATREIAHMPGAITAEGFRIVPVRLHVGHLSYRTSIDGVPPAATLRRPIDAELRPVAIPSEGLLLSQRLGERLGVRPGDRVDIEVLEGERPNRELRVAGLVNDQIGLRAYMDARALNRLMREDDLVTAVALSIDHGQADRLYAALKQVPKIQTVAIKALSLRAFRETTGLLVLLMATILTAFALTIAIGVVYNSARIALQERAWDLASLRVLGFTRGEVSTLLLGETAAEMIVAVPLGLWLGYWSVRLVVDLFETEMFKVPAVIAPQSYVLAAFAVLLAAVMSALIVRHRIDHLDLVAVLKARE